MDIQIYFNPIDRSSAGEDYTEDQLSAMDQVVIDELLKSVREKRNALLAESDWTEVADAPLSDGERAAWRTYRQSLRDFPATISFESAFALNDSDFPTKPE
jgi:hypothetical protein